jgi:hypothetical protein
MEGVNEVQEKRNKPRPPRGAARRSIHSHPHSHPLEVKRKAVQLYVEQVFSPELFARQTGDFSEEFRLFETQSGNQALVI